VGVVDEDISAVEAFVTSREDGSRQCLPTEFATDPARSLALRAMVLASVACRNGFLPETVKDCIGSMGSDALVQKVLLPEAGDKAVEAQLQAQFPAAAGLGSPDT
jgi:hypothetical protein